MKRIGQQRAKEDQEGSREIAAATTCTEESSRETGFRIIAIRVLFAFAVNSSQSHKMGTLLSKFFLTNPSCFCEAVFASAVNIKSEISTNELNHHLDHAQIIHTHSETGLYELSNIKQRMKVSPTLLLLLGYAVSSTALRHPMVSYQNEKPTLCIDRMQG